MNSPPILFDPARRCKHTANPAHDFLWREGTAILGESLETLTAAFPRILELRPRTPHLTALLHQRPGTERVEPAWLETEMLDAAAAGADAVISNMSLHTINDLLGVFIQARRALKPDGLLLITLPGARSLHELRHVLAETETTLYGGITPRVAPFVEVRDAGQLLQRAGFALPVVDSTTLTVTYPDLFALMHELRGAGEANPLATRQRRFTPRGFFAAAAARYAAQHGDGAGGIVATAEIITLSAWAPAATQQQPAARGSGTHSLTRMF